MFQQEVDLVTPHLALADAAEHGVLLEMVKHPEGKRNKRWVWLALCRRVEEGEELVGAVRNACALLKSVLGSAPALGVTKAAWEVVLRRESLPLYPLTTNYH